MQMEGECRRVYFPPELDHRQSHITEDILEEQFGKLRGQSSKLRMMAVGLVITMIFYVVDVVSDLTLAIHYAIVKDYLKCCATFAVVYFSSLVTTFVSVFWYRMIVQNKIQMYPDDTSGSMLRFPTVPSTLHGRVLTYDKLVVRYLYIFVLFLLQLAPIVNILISLKLIWRQLQTHPVEVYLEDRTTETSQNHQLNAIQDQTIQRDELNDLMEAKMHDELMVMGMIKMHGDYEEVLMTFLEDVPQALLQTSLLMIDVSNANGHFFTNFMAWWRVVAVIFSVLGVRGATRNYTSSITSYTFLIKGKPFRDPRKGILSLMRAIWHLLIPVGRASSLCYIATRFSYAVCVNIMLFYWVLMMVWLRNDFKNLNGIKKIVMFLTNTWIFIWVAASKKRAKTGRFYCMYYFILLADATSVCIISSVFAFRQDQHEALTIAGSLGLILQVLGVIIKFIYYCIVKKQHVTSDHTEVTNDARIVQ